MKKRQVTIDELAGMIKRRFGATATKADIEARFAEVDTRFDRAAAKEDIARLEREVKELRGDIAHLNRVPFALEQRVGRMEDDIRLIKTKVGMR